MSNGISYNLKVGRGKAIVAELQALRRMSSLITGMEAVGYGELPPLAGCRIVRDRSTDGRSNLYAYIGTEYGRFEETWIDLERTFPRKENAGPHPARSILKIDFEQYLAVKIPLVDKTFGGLRVIVGHAPPDWLGAGPAREEWMEEMVRLLAPWKRKGWRNRISLRKQVARLRPTLVLLDANQLGGELAKRTGFTLGGTTTEAALFRNLRVAIVRRIRTAARVQLKSDHAAVVVTWQ